MLVAGTGVYLAGQTSLLYALLSSWLVWLYLGGTTWLYLAYHTIGRDLLTISRFLHLLYVNFLAKHRDLSVSDKFRITARRLPDKPMIIMCGEGGDTAITFREVRELANQVARCFRQRGYKKGDVVALVMENRLDYCCYWLGLSMLGVVPALVNCNLRDSSLVYTITIASSKGVVYSAELEPAIADISGYLNNNVELFCVDDQKLGLALDLRTLLNQESVEDIDEKITGYKEDLFYIYTSGTTGLPKAAIIKSQRFMFTVYALYSMTKLTEKDVLYSPLPMYHTSAGAMATGNAMMEGLTLISRKKFSAKNFWSDIYRHKVTCAQYIGEIARYLYSSPVSEFEKKHCLRLMVGNGLRPELWEKFCERFGIAKINEFYGSTEGNCSVGNISGKTGSVGFISVLFPFLFPLGLIVVDEETREPVRDSRGFCIPCKPGQPGELVGRIERGHPVRDFHGYADKSATEKKVIYNVWRKGDMCFRSGDILVQDEFGWLYFKDRAGDTFRWKGENVSTAEVEAICSSVLDLKDCVVYGVEVAGCEGRAGMLAVPDAPGRESQLRRLFAGLETRLPGYARPLFVRLVDHIDITSTFKLKKRELQKEGIAEAVTDPIFIIDSDNRTYTPLTQDHIRNLKDGKLKL